MPDETSHRIHALISGVLEPVAVDASGWFSLYRDPADGRLWEHSYPMGYLHGGGPPELAVISSAEVLERYGIDLA